jgi:hypothetical protein
LLLPPLAVTRAAGAAGATGAHVRNAFIDAAGAMVADDIAANKRQGSYGVDVSLTATSNLYLFVR